MTVGDWLAFGSFLTVIVGGLILHARDDGRWKQKVVHLAKRMEKIDGIRNGD